jgi:hypothetical protein
LSDKGCRNLESKMKEVYDSVCLFSISTRQYHLDYDMKNLDKIRPLISEAFALWLKIPIHLQTGLGVAISMQLMSISANSI